MPKIAVMGANGFLGSQIVLEFHSRGWEVVALSRMSLGTSKWQEIQVDLFDDDSITSAISISKPDVVLSTAWYTEHGKFWTNESNIAYRDATLRFAKLSFQSDVETFVGLGSMCEYGFSPGLCDAKTTPLEATDEYSKSKIETGLALEAIGNKFGHQTHWARVFQAFGPNEKRERFVPSLIAGLQKGDKFSIRTPNFEMDWIHTTDAASAIAFMIEKKLDHFVDIGTGVGTTVQQLSELICEEFDLDPGLLDYLDQIPGHQNKVLVDSKSQLFSAGWLPTESLRNRIRSLR